MQQEEQPEFDDPGLKAAVRRAFEGERAPAGLRETIVGQMVAHEGEVGAGRQAQRQALSRERQGWRMWLGPNPMRTLVAACVAIVAVSVAIYQIKTNFFPSAPAPAKQMVAELPATFAMEMVKTHTAHAKLPDHHLVPGDEFTKLRETLTAQVKVPVAAMDLAGWQFKGAGVCKVGNVAGAHLIYANSSGQTISVFSLPADAVYAASEGATYSQTVDGHPLSGFKQGSGLYCVVGSSGNDVLTMAQVEKLRDMLHACLPPVECGHGGMGALARK
jgi:hypothetical protein